MYWTHWQHLYDWLRAVALSSVPVESVWWTLRGFLSNLECLNAENVDVKTELVGSPTYSQKLCKMPLLHWLMQCLLATNANPSEPISVQENLNFLVVSAISEQFSIPQRQLLPVPLVWPELEEEDAAWSSASELSAEMQLCHTAGEAEFTLHVCWIWLSLVILFKLQIKLRGNLHRCCFGELSAQVAELSLGKPVSITAHCHTSKCIRLVAPRIHTPYSECLACLPYV